MYPREKARSLLLSMGYYDAALHAGIAAWARAHDWELDTSLISRRFLPARGEWVAVVATVDRPEVVEWINGLDCPVVRMIEAVTPELEKQVEHVPKIECDHQSAGQIGARHLLTLGNVNFGFYCQTGGADARTIQRSFLGAMHAAGRTPFLLDFRGEHPDIPVGQAIPRETWIAWLERKLSKIEFPAAIMAEDDRFALALAQMARRLGLRIPTDLAILGVDDNRLLLGASPVGISSVDSDLWSVGYHAADLAARLSEGETPPAAATRVPARQVIARESTATFHGNHPKADEALRYIRNHFRSHLSVETVAGHVGLTPRGLHKILAKEACPSLHQEILRLRLEAAEQLLTESTLKLDAIAAETGLGNAKNLCRVFLKHRGITPQQRRLKR